MKGKVAFTLRFNSAFYDRIRTVSERGGRSVTSFVQEAVARKLDDEEAASLFQAFTLVGEDTEGRASSLHTMPSRRRRIGIPITRTRSF